jgi:energy-coupling factor transport system substrate-specific component
MNMMNYYLISFIVIAVALVIFALRFEGRKPKAREIVVLAVMVALAVAGRAAFFMVPQFKPVAALVIISGVALGAESGFLVGVLAAFVSNFIFGQGPWTPFQMIAFGLIGLLAGLFFQRRYARPVAASVEYESARPLEICAQIASLRVKKRSDWQRVHWLCLYGALSVMFLYGFIVDIASLLMFSESVDLQSMLAILVSGIPFNIMHAVSTVIFLLVLAHPMLEKLERVKQKFALLGK